MFLKKILRIFYFNFICYILYLPFIIFLSFILIFKNIRFGVIQTHRVGHLLTNTELYLLNKKLKNKNTFDIIYKAKGIANKQAFKMIKRKLKIFPSQTVHVHRFFKIFSNTKFEIDVYKKNGDRDKLNLLSNSITQIDFTEEEVEFGKKFIFEKFNCNVEKDKIIFLCVRDSEYLNKTFPKKNWDYHSYRDWKVDNFIEGCEKMTEKGYKIFRVGKYTNQKINSNNKNIYDYVNSNYRNDFIDIFLAKFSKFAVSTALGIDNAALIFRKPIAMIHVPFELSYFHNSNLIMTKHHYCKKKKRNLSISEIFEVGKKNNFKYDTVTYRNNGISLKENSSKEITDFLIEMDLRVNNKFIGSDEHNKDLEEEFWKIFKFYLKQNDLGNMHGYFSGNISNSFLKNNPDFLR